MNYLRSKINLSIFTAAILFCSANLKAQDDDPVCGLYVDGVKIKEITCYSFGTLTVVFPYNNAYTNYDKIAINIYDGADPLKGQSSHHSSREIPIASLFKYVKGKYMVYELISKDKQNLNAEDPTGSDPYGHYLVTRGSMQYYSGGLLAEGSKDEVLYVGVTALKANGEFVEGYNESTHQYYRYPKWDIENLNAYQVPLLNRQKLKIGLMSADTPNNKAIDLSQPCTTSGTKVDFNTVGGKSSSSVTSTTTQSNDDPAPVEIKKTTATTKTTSSATNKTIITTVAPTSSATVKALDKTKAGYFEEKSEDGKWLYRAGYQKSAGVYHGEVREYENGKLDKINIYSDGQEDGLYVGFDSNGKVEWSGTYKMGKKDGVWKKYKDGQLDTTEKYVDGEEQD